MKKSSLIYICALLLCCRPNVSEPLDWASREADPRCSKTMAAQANQSVLDAIEALESDRCSEVLHETWRKKALRRLRNREIKLRCTQNEPNPGHTVAYYARGYINLGPIFFNRGYSRVERTGTMLHEIAHGVDAPAPIGHSWKFKNIRFYFEGKGLGEFFYARDPVYFCSYYCSRDDLELKAVMKQKLKLAMAYQDSALMREYGGKLLEEVDRYDWKQHAKATCIWDPKFPRYWFE